MNRQPFDIRRKFSRTLRDISRGASVSRAVIRNRQIIIHGLGYPHDKNVFLQRPAGFVEFTAGIHRAVTAVHKDAADLMFFENPHHRFIFRCFQLISGRTDRAARCLYKKPESVFRHIRQIDELFPQEPSGSIFRGEDSADGFVLPRFHHRSVQGGVHDGCRSSAVYYQNRFFPCFTHSLHSFPKPALLILFCREV